MSADELERYGQARRAGRKAALLAETGAKMQWSQCLDEHASVLNSKEDVISTTRRVSMRDSTYKSRSNFSPKSELPPLWASARDGRKLRNVSDTRLHGGLTHTGRAANNRQQTQRSVTVRHSSTFVLASHAKSSRRVMQHY